MVGGGGLMIWGACISPVACPSPVAPSPPLSLIPHPLPDMEEVKEQILTEWAEVSQA